jgi:hypothetical protein
MSQSQDPRAVKVARAHVEAWATKDWDTARSMLAPDVHVIAMTTNPAIPVTDLTGTDNYMQGLTAFAGPVVPGTVRELASAGDEHNALITLDMRVAGGPFGAGADAPCARHYLIDDDGKIQAEQIVFYIGQA